MLVFYLKECILQSVSSVLRCANAFRVGPSFSLLISKANTFHSGLYKPEASMSRPVVWWCALSNLWLQKRYLQEARRKASVSIISDPHTD